MPQKETHASGHGERHEVLKGVHDYNKDHPEAPIQLRNPTASMVGDMDRIKKRDNLLQNLHDYNKNHPKSSIEITATPSVRHDLMRMETAPSSNTTDATNTNTTNRHAAHPENKRPE